MRSAISSQYFCSRGVSIPPAGSMTPNVLIQPPAACGRSAAIRG